MGLTGYKLTVATPLKGFVLIPLILYIPVKMLFMSLGPEEVFSYRVIFGRRSSACRTISLGYS